MTVKNQSHEKMSIGVKANRAKNIHKCESKTHRCRYTNAKIKRMFVEKRMHECTKYINVQDT